MALAETSADDLLDQMATDAESVGPRWICTTCKALRSLSPERAAKMEVVLASTRWTYDQVASLLGRFGFEVAAFSVGRHIRGQCATGGGKVYRERRESRR